MAFRLKVPASIALIRFPSWLSVCAGLIVALVVLRSGNPPVNDLFDVRHCGRTRIGGMCRSHSTADSHMIFDKGVNVVILAVEPHLAGNLMPLDLVAFESLVCRRAILVPHESMDSHAKAIPTNF
jgi:hypothetical protein